ncbi:MAG: alpha/beta hydrolase [bacterium]|nr:alpha/beta hydrolase [bacterium]
MRFFILSLLVLFIQTSLFAGGSKNEDKCDTKYPVVLAHGFAANEGMFGFLDYFYGIEEALEDEGASVYTTTVNCMDSTANKGVEFRRQVLEILAITNKSKVNIIGHSHGGVYARYAITNLTNKNDESNFGDHVASLSTLDAPHQGSSGPDIVVELCGGETGEKILGSVVDFIYGNIVGDNNPNGTQNCYDMQTEYMQKIFNPATPDVPGVYYQSWAGKIKYISVSNAWAAVLWAAIGLREGANDGCVSVYSSKWGNYRGEVTGSWWSNGVDHIRIINQPFGITPGFDAKGFYVDIVDGLKDMGY